MPLIPKPIYNRANAASIGNISNKEYKTDKHENSRVMGIMFAVKNKKCRNWRTRALVKPKALPPVSMSQQENRYCHRGLAYIPGGDVKKLNWTAGKLFFPNKTIFALPAIRHRQYRKKEYSRLGRQILTFYPKRVNKTICNSHHEKR